jgi:hypothetical protein
MILFGVAFWATMAVGLKQFAAVEGQPFLQKDFEAVEDAKGR